MITVKLNSEVELFIYIAGMTCRASFLEEGFNPLSRGLLHGTIKSARVSCAYF